MKAKTGDIRADKEAWHAKLKGKSRRLIGLHIASLGRVWILAWYARFEFVIRHPVF